MSRFDRRFNAIVATALNIALAAYLLVAYSVH